MQTKPGSKTWVDPDDAPPLTSEMLANAEVFEGNIPVRRGRGRPSTGNARELISVRLDRNVVAKLREAGPGWQSQINSLLRAALQLNLEQPDVDPPVERKGRGLSSRVSRFKAKSLSETTSRPKATGARQKLTPKINGRTSRRSKVGTGKPHLSGSHER